jgi:hypothetical protein
LPEQVDLAVPIVPASRTSYTLKRLHLDWAAGVIQIYLTGSDGVEVFAEYTGAPALAILVAFNKVDLTVKSLQRRVLERLVADGKLPGGAVSGAPA